MNKLTSFYALLTLLLIISARADNPPLKGKPIALESTKEPSAVKTNAPAHVIKTPLTPMPTPPVKTPIYIVPRVKWVQTPQGVFPLIPEKNWPDLIFLFPSADQTNLTFYSTSP